MNYEANTTHWKPGDIVIHDADKKDERYLMVVIGYDSKTGQCKTRYRLQEAFGLPKNRICRNHIEVLHDPARFGIATPKQANVSSMDTVE